MATRRAITAAAIYTRISQDRSGEALGVERQREDCERLARANGWPVVDRYSDNDVSAYSGKRRREYERLLSDIEGGRVDAVLAWHPDRLHRSPKELERFIDVVEAAGAAVHTVTAGIVDLSTPDGRMIARMLGATARRESEHNAERIARKHEELAQRGEPIRGGTRPFGLSADWSTIVEPEAALIREAVARVLDGGGIRGIAKDWQRRGIKTPAGNAWRATPLRRMLTSAHLAGLREHKGYEKGRRRTEGAITKGTWPAIIDRPTLDRLRIILRDPSRRTVTVNARRYLLSGLLECGLCRSRLVARPRVDKVRRYVCATGPSTGGCGKVAILAEPTEELIREAILYRLDSPEVEAARALDRPSTSGLAEAVAQDRAALAELSDDYYVAKLIDRAGFLATRRTLEARIAAGERAIAQSQAAIVTMMSGASARAAWEERGFDWQRALVAAMVDRITVGPGRRGYNRFDPDRITPTWRG